MTMKILSLVLLAWLAAASAAPAQERIERSIPTRATGSLEIVNPSGSVEVVGWDRNEIQVTGTVGRGTERVEINDRRIRVVLPRNARNVRGTELRIRVPQRKDVSVETVSADIGVEGIRGGVEAQSVSGEVEVAGSPREVRVSSTSGDIGIHGSATGRVTAEAVSGNIDVDAATPDVRARSVSGEIDLRGVRERVTATTVSGEVRVVGEGVRFASLESVSGDLEFAGSFAPRASATLESHSGNVILRLPPDAPLDVDVTTFSGGIENAFGPEARRTSRYAPGRELRFATGRGGARVSANTFSGNVKLLRR